LGKQMVTRSEDYCESIFLRSVRQLLKLPAALASAADYRFAGASISGSEGSRSAGRVCSISGVESSKSTGGHRQSMDLTVRSTLVAAVQSPAGRLQICRQRLLNLHVGGKDASGRTNHHCRAARESTGRFNDHKSGHDQHKDTENTLEFVRFHTQHYSPDCCTHRRNVKTACTAAF
jgi:hypothetical protein